MSEDAGRLVQVNQLVEQTVQGKGTWTSSTANDENVM